MVVKDRVAVLLFSNIRESLESNEDTVMSTPIHKQVPVTDIIRGCVYTVAMNMPDWNLIGMDAQGSIVIKVAQEVINSLEEKIQNELLTEEMVD
jgi:hypothetical protein